MSAEDDKDLLRRIEFLRRDIEGTEASVTDRSINALTATRYIRKACFDYLVRTERLVLG